MTPKIILILSPGLSLNPWYTWYFITRLGFSKMAKPWIARAVIYSTFANATNLFSAMFHFCCWAVVSALRYIYIIHNDWIHDRFPQTWMLNALAMGATFFSYFLVMLLNVLVCISFGWPKVKVFEMPFHAQAICAGLVFGILFVFIFISCAFYLLIMKERGKFQNKVAPCDPIQHSSLDLIPESTGAVYHRIDVKILNFNTNKFIAQ